MGACDVVASNISMIYVGVMVGVKAYGVVYGRNYSGGYVVIVSTTLVTLMLLATLTWDLSRKAKDVFVGDHHHHPRTHQEMSCKGGICWHGVAERSPASHVRFRLPQHVPHGTV